MSPHRAWRADCRRRLGWLLRSNRIHSPHPAHRRLVAFTELYARETGERVAVSTISRWETGVSPYSHSVARAYERLIGVRSYQISAVADSVSRFMSGRTSALPPVRRSPTRLTDSKLDELLERVQCHGMMTASQWDLLTGAISRSPELRLSPSGLWAELAERLLLECAIADGLSWVLRAEAFHRLMAHPVGGSAAVSATASAAADSSAQSLVGSVSVFDASADPAASSHVLRHLMDPVSDRTFYGGLLASVRKVRLGHFNAADLRRLLGVVVDALTADVPAPTAALAAAVLQMLPAGLRSRVSQRLLRTVAERLGRNRTQSATATRIAHAALRQMEGSRPTEGDEILLELVDEMLHGLTFDDMFYAQVLISATPYRQPVATALGRELLASLRARPQSAVVFLDALRVLGGISERRHVEQLFLAEGVAGEVRDAAAAALGHVGGTSDPGFWTSAYRHISARWEDTRLPCDYSAMDRLVYAMGMADIRDTLVAVTLDRRIPQSVQRSAEWWVNIPTYVRDSAKAID